MPGFQVQMGMGLHVGWAIEGAIGSKYKIDASYLSPNVNMSARLEAATKQFGVPLLVSDRLYDSFSMETKRELRPIDKVTVKGSIMPMELFTCDLNVTDFTVDMPETQLDAQDKKRLRVKARIRRDNLRESVISGERSMSNQFSTDADLLVMRSSISQDFIETFIDGYNFYLDGDWQKAKDNLEKAIEFNGSVVDGPTASLLRVMGEQNFKAPKDWRG